MCCLCVHYSEGSLRSQHVLDVLVVLNKSVLCLVPQMLNSMGGELKKNSTRDQWELCLIFMLWECM